MAFDAFAALAAAGAVISVLILEPRPAKQAPQRAENAFDFNEESP